MQAMKLLPTRGRDVVERWCGFDKNGKASGGQFDQSSDNKTFLLFTEYTP